MLNNKIILVIGGTGSFGQCFIKKVLEENKPKKLIIFSRDEMKQYELEQKYPMTKYNAIRYFIGDVRDLPRLKLAMKDVDIVIHAAALKQVPAAEYNPFEAIKTNVIGAQNVIDAAISSNVSKVIALSTDKAAAPINLYGATKLCADKLFVAANNYSKRQPKFSVVRYGNVAGSRGSVIPFFLKCKNTGVLPITDKRMTRFNISLKQGVDFVIECLQKMWGGEIFIPKIPSYNIVDVARAIDSNCKIEFVGIRPGEKLHEDMITSTDALNTIEFKNYYVILPSSRSNWDIEKFIKESDKHPGCYVPEGFYYNSKKNSQFLSVDQIREIISSLEGFNQ